jgi:hypothetical protein
MLASYASGLINNYLLVRITVECIAHIQGFYFSHLTSFFGKTPNGFLLVAVGFLLAALGFLLVAVAFLRAAIVFLLVVVAFLRVAVALLLVAVGFLRAAIGLLLVAVVFLRVAVGFLRAAIGFLGCFSCLFELYVVVLKVESPKIRII